MDDIKLPIRVAIFDDDYYALKWNTALVMRDPRTTVVIETQSSNELLDLIEETGDVDVILVDAEYENPDLPFESLVTKIKLNDHPKVICFSQYGRRENILTAFKLDVDGYLIKDDVRMAIVPGIMKCYLDKKIITPKVEGIINESFPELLSKFEVIPKWVPNPKITPQILIAFWMRVFFGMRSPLVAEEMGVAKGTIDRYVNLAYDILPSDLVDEEYLFGLDIEKFSAEDRAFLWFTLPPNKNKSQ